jgi:hypothetical protein
MVDGNGGGSAAEDDDEDLCMLLMMKCGTRLMTTYQQFNRDEKMDLGIKI